MTEEKTCGRIFYALAFSDETKGALGTIRTGLRRRVGRGSWVRPENFHLTLRFLGEVGIREIDGYRAGLDRAVRGIVPFRLEFGGWGSFRQRGGRLIYLGVKDSSGNLERLASRLREIPGPGDPGEDKSFCPHVTFGRRCAVDGEVWQSVRNWCIELPSVRITEAVLFETVPSDGRVRYRPIHRAVFKS